MIRNAGIPRSTSRIFMSASHLQRFRVPGTTPLGHVWLAWRRNSANAKTSTAVRMMAPAFWAAVSGLRAGR